MISKGHLTLPNSLFYCTIFSQSASIVNHGTSLKLVPITHQLTFYRLHQQHSIGSISHLSGNKARLSHITITLMNSLLQRMRSCSTSPRPTEPLKIILGNVTTTSVRCLGVEWHSNLSAKESVSTNIAKAKKAFFGLGSTMTFHSDLNPSSSNIFETCSPSFILIHSIFRLQTGLCCSLLTNCSLNVL